MKDWHSRKVRFVKATLKQKGEACHASVELEASDGASFMGSAEGPSAETELFRAGALAAAKAVEQASGIEDVSVELQDLAVVPVLGGQVVLVSLAARARGEIRSLWGVCHVHGDPAAAGALAVLNATNRMLDLA